MATSRLTIRSQLRNDLRIDPNGKVWSDSVLNQLIHEAEIEVCRRNITISALEKTDTFNAAIGKRAYSLSTNLTSPYARIISVIYDAKVIANYTASTIAFVDSNPDTITDSANGFVTAGFTAGMKLQVYNSSSNDGVNHLTIATVSAGTITLSSSDAVTAEAAGSSISLIGDTFPDHSSYLKKVEDIREIELNSLNSTASYPTSYALFNDSLYFNVLPKEADLIQVRYVQIPDEMSTDGTNSDMPDELIPLVRLWAQYLAWGQIPEEFNNMNSAATRFEREIRRKITTYGMNDYQNRIYASSNWRSYRY